jgi:hypothetical protein
MKKRSFTSTSFLSSFTPFDELTTGRNIGEKLQGENKQKNIKPHFLLSNRPFMFEISFCFIFFPLWAGRMWEQ